MGRPRAKLPRLAVRLAALVLMPLVLMTAGCTEVAGVAANAALRTDQTGSAEDLEKRLSQRFAAEPALARLKVSVARANVWRDAFESRYSVLLAGTVADEAARGRAAELVRDTIGGDPTAIAILDRSRMVPPSPE